MSNIRLSYAELSPNAFQHLVNIKLALDKSSLAQDLLELIYLRISQINGCAFCLIMHAKALREKNVPSDKIDGVAGWKVSHHFSAKEKAALSWAESLTNIANTHDVPDEIFLELQHYFSDKEISDLSFAVALMNAFNRLAIGMRQ